MRSQKFNTFLTDCGRLGHPDLARYRDFHPGNTYTTNMITTTRGYTARELSVADFRDKVEKRMFDRDYTAEEDVGQLCLLSRRCSASGGKGRH